MEELQELYDKRLKDLVEEAVSFDITSEDFTNATRNLRLYSELRPLMPKPAPLPEPEPVPEPVHVPTRWEKVKAAASSVWDNETTRVFIKAGGAFAGVALVANATIQKDHVMERQALAQANQRSV